MTPPPPEIQAGGDMAREHAARLRSCFAEKPRKQATGRRTLDKFVAPSEQAPCSMYNQLAEAMAGQQLVAFSSEGGVTCVEYLYCRSIPPVGLEGLPAQDAGLGLTVTAEGKQHRVRFAWRGSASARVEVATATRMLCAADFRLFAKPKHVTDKVHCEGLKQRLLALVPGLVRAGQTHGTLTPFTRRLKGELVKRLRTTVTAGRDFEDWVGEAAMDMDTAQWRYLRDWPAGKELALAHQSKLLARERDWLLEHRPGALEAREAAGSRAESRVMTTGLFGPKRPRLS